MNVEDRADDRQGGQIVRLSVLFRTVGAIVTELESSESTGSFLGTNSCAEVYKCEELDKKPSNSFKSEVSNDNAQSCVDETQNVVLKRSSNSLATGSYSLSQPDLTVLSLKSEELSLKMSSTAALPNKTAGPPLLKLPVIDYDADNEDNDTATGDNESRSSQSVIGADLTKFTKNQLEIKLAPIEAALKALDVKSILSLEVCDVEELGVPAGDGILVKPVHTMVQPPVVPPFRYRFNEKASSNYTPVRYLHVYELPNHYSAGIFVFPPHAKIPLHDHPGMCVLSRILYGSLSVHSYDWIQGEPLRKDLDNTVSPANWDEDEDDDMSEETDPMEKLIQSRVQALGAANSLYNSWLGKATQEFSKWSTRALSNSTSNLFRAPADQNAMDTDDSDSYDHGTKSRRRRPKRQKARICRRLARRRPVRIVNAPAVTVLYPYEGNVHEFVAGSKGAAVLDVLLPPYDEKHDRDCTFYIPEEDTLHHEEQSGDVRLFLRQIPQPEEFQCVSGTYGNLGVLDED